jgi:hypothetical protein
MHALDIPGISSITVISLIRLTILIVMRALVLYYIVRFCSFWYWCLMPDIKWVLLPPQYSYFSNYKSNYLPL